MISHSTGAGRRYHHNGDFSGEVRINVAENEIERYGLPDGSTGYSVDIPWSDLADIVQAGIEARYADATLTVAVRYPLRDGQWRLAGLADDGLPVSLE